MIKKEKKELILKLIKKGRSYVDIAKEVEATPDSIRKFLKRNFQEEVSQVKQEKKNLCNSSYENYKETEDIVFMRTFSGNKPAKFECNMSDASFISWNRQAYKSDKKGNLIYDKERNGTRPADCPQRFEPVLI